MSPLAPTDFRAVYGDASFTRIQVLLVCRKGKLCDQVYHYVSVWVNRIFATRFSARISHPISRKLCRISKGWCVDDVHVGQGQGHRVNV